MNRYPLWKYLLIAAAMVLGFLYTLPNFFGEAPAIQISPLRTTAKVDTGLMKQVEESLKLDNIAYQGVFLDATSIKVRFKDTDTQLKAKDLMQAKLGAGYVVALNLLPSSPAWLTSMRALPMYLGLDLRGGVHFLLQVDMKAALDKSVERYNGDIRTTLREKKIYYSGISRTGQSVEVKFRDADARIKANKKLPMPTLIYC